MRNNNILFILHEVDFIDNFGISLLSAVAKKTGWNTHLTVFDRRTIDRVFEEVRPEIVCYSSMSSDNDIYLKINRALKAKYKFVSILGGSHATFFPEVINEEGIDFICIGEGELAFQDFLLRYKNGESVEHVQNFWSKDFKNPLRDLVGDLDSLPLPDRAIIFDNTELGKTPIKTFMSSRGCSFACSYCYNNTLISAYKGKGTYMRTHSVERVIAEIEEVRSRYPLAFIKFEDDLFGMSPSWLAGFAPAYRKKVGIPFNCLLRLDIIDKDKAGLLKEAGCQSVTVSIDSANQRVRNEVLNRKMRLTNDDIVEKLLLLKKAGIRVMTNSIVGVPTSTIEDEISCVDLNIKGRVDYANATILVPYPKTDIWNFCLSRRMLDGQLNADMFMSIQKKSTLSCFSEKEKNTQWNISAFYATMVRFPAFKRALLYVAAHTGPNPVFSFWCTVLKSCLMKKYIYTFQLGVAESLRLALKALRIEMSRMLGIKATSYRRTYGFRKNGREQR